MSSEEKSSKIENFLLNKKRKKERKMNKKGKKVTIKEKNSDISSEEYERIRKAR